MRVILQNLNNNFIAIQQFRNLSASVQQIQGGHHPHKASSELLFSFWSDFFNRMSHRRAE